MTTAEEPNGPPSPGFRLAIGSGTVEVPAGTIVAVCGGTDSGLQLVASEVRAAVTAPKGSTRGASRSPAGVGRIDGSPLSASAVAFVALRSALTPLSSVAENIFLNRLVVKRVGPIPVGLDWNRMRSESAEALHLVGAGPAGLVTTLARDLSERDRLLVELARAASRGAELLVIEEPAATLHTAAEIDGVLAALDGFRARGVAVVVLTQKPRQALGYADSVVVVRRGAIVARHERAQWQAEGTDALRRRILNAMVGESGPHADRAAGALTASTAPELLRIEGWSARDLLPPNSVVVDGVSLTLAEGEIVGLTGLARSGAETLLLSVYGRSAGIDARGRVLVRGAEIDTSTVQQSIEAGLYFASADAPRYRLRMAGGISVPVAANRMRGLAAAGMLEEKPDDDRLAGRVLDALRSSGREGDAVTRIRGLVREFAASERSVLMLGEPWRGASVAERAEIVSGLGQATRAGKGVIVVSDDLETLLGLCDRVVAMAEGRVTGEVPGGSAPAELAPLIAPD